MLQRNKKIGENGLSPPICFTFRRMSCLSAASGKMPRAPQFPDARSLYIPGSVFVGRHFILFPESPQESRERVESGFRREFVLRQLQRRISQQALGIFQPHPVYQVIESRPQLLIYICRQRGPVGVQLIGQFLQR